VYIDVVPITLWVGRRAPGVRKWPNANFHGLGCAEWPNANFHGLGFCHRYRYLGPLVLGDAPGPGPRASRPRYVTLHYVPCLRLKAAAYCIGVQL